MKSKLIVFVTLPLAIMLSCVRTTGVFAPVEIEPNQNFEIIVYSEITEKPSQSLSGLLAILIPEVWSVDSVVCNGYGYTGPFEFCNFSTNISSWPFRYYEPDTGYIWWVFGSPDDNLYGYSAETGYAVVTITTTDSLGRFQPAFLAAASEGMAGVMFDGDPCSCIVDVVQLNLEQETWGTIKSELGQ